VDELDSKRLRPARYILVGPRSWQERSLRDIVGNEAIVDFNERDDATFRYLRKHRLHALAHHERFFANNTDALASMVAGGCGYSVLADDFARPLIQSKQLIALNPGKDICLEFGLAWYPRHQMPAYFRDLIRGIR
jgi:DNA-binding transcriptional LysR family regulator